MDPSTGKEFDTDELNFDDARLLMSKIATLHRPAHVAGVEDDWEEMMTALGGRVAQTFRTKHGCAWGGKFIINPEDVDCPVLFKQWTSPEFVPEDYQFLMPNYCSGVKSMMEDHRATLKLLLHDASQFDAAIVKAYAISLVVEALGGINI